MSLPQLVALWFRGHHWKLRTLQRPSLKTHDKSKEHEKAKILWNEKERRSMMPVNVHLQKMDSTDSDKKVSRVSRCFCK